MHRPYGKYNPKRKMLAQNALSETELLTLSQKVSYCGNPAHKKNPGDFGLTPPSGLRSSKSLCDVAEIFEKMVADELLREGVRRGLISRQFRGGWPQNVWAVSETGVPLEAQLENQETGAYHGYSMPSTDPFIAEVLTRWRESL